MPRDRVGLAIVLPIVTACADQTQKEQAQTWTDQFFNVQYTTDWTTKHATSDTEEKALLLDPIRVVRMPSTVSDKTLAFWSQSLQRKAPQYAGAPFVTFLSQNDWNPNALAWYLPDLCAASPVFGKAMVAAALESAERTDTTPGTNRINASFAAYRLSLTDPTASNEFLQTITDPQTKAETLQAIASGSANGSALSKAQAERVEALLRGDISNQAARSGSGSPVRNIMRLVRFLDKRNEQAKAEQELTKAVSMVGGDPENVSRDTTEIARYKRKAKSPDYEQWWKKALDLSQAVDERHMPDSGDGSIYISGRSAMAKDLLDEGKIDDALAIARSMNKELMKDNRAMIMDRVIVAVLKTDTKRAISLLSDYPDMNAKHGITGVIAAKVSESDVAAALDLLKGIPGTSRTTALLRVASTAPTRKAEQVLSELRASIAAGTKAESPESMGWGLGGGVRDRYAALQLDSLLSLSDAFRQAPARYAAILLACIVDKAGLADDPIWIQYWGTERFKGDPTPWGASSLRYLVKDL
jgi:hypothetical protein